MTDSVTYVTDRILIDPAGHWVWMRPLTNQGYGGCSIAQNQRSAGLAHRLSYETFIGPIPEGLTVDHLCRVRSCVNPAHLEAVTAKENTLRGRGITATNIAKTHCTKGHPFDDANTIVNRRGHRKCRLCNNAFGRETRLRRLARAAELGHFPVRKSPASTHCQRGHALTDENAYRYRGTVKCRPCGALTARSRRGRIDAR
jgi:hypothetical protein